MAGFLPLGRDARPDITDYERWYYNVGQYRKYPFYKKRPLFISLFYHYIVCFFCVILLCGEEKERGHNHVQ